MGGKALFIMPNISPLEVVVRSIKTSRFGKGDFFFDDLRLDSSVTNAIMISGGKLQGDLKGCATQSIAYPYLKADSIKLSTGAIPVEGYIPLSGCLFPRDSVEVLYTYNSSYPDSTFEGQINGVKIGGGDCRAIIFNFPMALMSEPENTIALRQALSDLGVDLSCGDVNYDNACNVGDIVFLVQYLFRGGPAPNTERADVDCDGTIGMPDIITIINQIFKKGPGLACCR